MSGDLDGSNSLRAAGSTDDPKILYNALVNIPRSSKYRCLYSLDSEGMTLLEWAISNNYWNAAHLLVYYAWIGVDFQLEKYSVQRPCVVPSKYWNQIVCHTICLLNYTAPIRNPQLSNDELPPALQQRLAIFIKAQAMKCFDIREAVGDEIAFIILLRLGEDATQKNSANVPIILEILSGESWRKRCLPSLKFIAKQHPLIGYTERDEKNVSPLTFCLYNNLLDFFNSLKNDEALEKLAVEGLLSPYITEGRHSAYFSEAELENLLSKRQEDLEKALLKDISLSTIRPGVFRAAVGALKQGRNDFMNKVNFDKVPIFAAHLIQHHVGDSVPGLHYMKQRWRRNFVSNFTAPKMEFPIDQLPLDLIISIAKYLLADDLLALLLTTNKSYKLIGSTLCQRYLLDRNTRAQRYSNDFDFKSAVLARAKTGVKWRFGELTRKHDIRDAHFSLVHKEWSVLEQHKPLALRWDTLELHQGPFKTVFVPYKPVVVDATPSTLTAIVVDKMFRAELGTFGSAEPAHKIALPPYELDSKYPHENHFVRDKQRFVFGNQLHEMDLTTCQVVTSLPHEYYVSRAKSHHFDPATIVAYSKDESKVLLVDRQSRVTCSVPLAVPAPALHDFHMVSEHHLLCVCAQELTYYDVRYPSQAMHVLDMPFATQHWAIDVPCHRLIVHASTPSSLMTLDLNAMKWDRVFLTPNLSSLSTLQLHVHEQYLCHTVRGAMTVCEMK